MKSVLSIVAVGSCFGLTPASAQVRDVGDIGRDAGLSQPTSPFAIRPIRAA